MNDATNAQPKKRNITMQGEAHPTYCDHEDEVIAHLLGDALKRGSLEAYE